MKIVGTFAQWKQQGYKVAKGATAAARITARGFWPLPVFTAEQVNAGDLEGFTPDLPDVAAVDQAHAELVQRLDAGEKARVALEAVAESLEQPADTQLALAA